MDRASFNALLAEGLSNKDLELLQSFIETKTGIKTPPQKKSLLEGRLYKRLKALNIDSYRAYCEFLFSPEGIAKELSHFINVITTNKTDFFREREHFDFLSSHALKNLLFDGNHHLKNNHLAFWSAGCSTGEEPYTLAMVLEEYRSQNSLAFDYQILGTDLSTDVLARAVRGVYPEEAIIPIPMELRRRYLLRSRDDKRKLVRFLPDIRAKIRFCNLNFMDEKYNIHPMDVIFCRNVIIYFNQEVQMNFMGKLINYLKPGGYLFIGHSENIHGFGDKLIRIGHSIYQKVY